jgi:hypothetical protein
VVLYIFLLFEELLSMSQRAWYFCRKEKEVTFGTQDPQINQPIVHNAWIVRSQCWGNHLFWSRSEETPM